MLTGNRRKDVKKITMKKYAMRKTVFFSLFFIAWCQMVNAAELIVRLENAPSTGNAIFLLLTRLMRSAT